MENILWHHAQEKRWQSCGDLKFTHQISGILEDNLEGLYESCSSKECIQNSNKLEGSHLIRNDPKLYVFYKGRNGAWGREVSNKPPANKEEKTLTRDEL